MSSPKAILICDRDAAFREALRNLLFAAGYPAVEVVGTVREGLARLRRRRYRCILLGIPRLLSMERRWTMVVRQRQPGARLLFVVPADDDTTSIGTVPFEYVIKERVFATLLPLAENGAEGCGLQ
jgi:DNA-binding NtrC family response regulator